MANAARMRLGLPLTAPGGVGTAATLALNATTVSVAWFFESETTDPITWLAIRRNSITGTPGTYRLSLQGVDASGNPDGAIKASGNAFVTFTGGSLTNGAVNRLNLGASYTPAIGEELCYVLEYSSGTVDGSNFLTVTTTSTSSTGHPSKFPCVANGASGVYTRQGGLPLLAYGTASTAYGFPVNASATQNINSGATAEAGAKATLFAGLTGTFKIKGASVIMGTTIAAKSITCSIYTGGGASDTTAAQTTTKDSDLSTLGTTGSLDFLFESYPLPTYNMGDTFRVALSTPDASNQAIIGISVSTAGDMDAFQLGNNFTLSTRSGGNWTDTATTRLFFELILEDISFSGGSGGAPGARIFGMEMGPALSQ